MTRFVIGPDVALALAAQNATLPTTHQVLAPTLLRSQVLAQLYAEVRLGALTRKEANKRLDYLRELKIRLLGDRTLQRVAWQIAEGFEWDTTFVAEYVALARLQADALVVLDAGLAKVLARVVPVAGMSDLIGAARAA